MTYEEFIAADRARYQAALQRNARLLELARHNGYAIDVRERCDGARHWFVPHQLVTVAGYQVAMLP